MTHLYTEDPKKSWNPVKRLSHCHCAKINDGTKPSLLARLLMLFVPHLDIIKAIDIKSGAPKVVSVYLRRFYLFRAKWIGWLLTLLGTIPYRLGLLTLSRIFDRMAHLVNKHVGDLYLHNIIRSDDDPDPHDHPWGFTGFIISGGYLDESYSWQPAHTYKVNNSPGFIKRFMPDGGYAMEPTHVPVAQFVSVPGMRLGPSYEHVKPLSIIRRKATHIHRVVVPTDSKGAWTLIFTSPYSREWNFITENGPVLWTKYLGIPEGQDVGT